MGERYGEYELIRKIATGGMAEIYLARLISESGFGRPVVVKRMLPQLAVRDDFVTMFLDEARLAANLVHPNIVQVFNLGETDGSYFMAMELIDGPHLGALFAHSLRRRKPLPIEFCAYAVARAADGLEYAHNLVDPASGKALNIVHRDISPQNVLVSRQGDVKVTDFGVAKADSQEAKTRTGIIKGKVSYMSPEQCLGEVVDRRTDVFALGIVLYELLTRRRLFRDKSDLLVMQRITKGDIKPPSAINKAVDPELDDIALSALTRKRGDRLPSAAALSERLDYWLATQKHVDCRGKLARWMGKEAPELGLSPEDTDAGSRPSWMEKQSSGSRDSLSDAGSQESTSSTPALDAARIEADAEAQARSAQIRARMEPEEPTLIADKTNPDQAALPAATVEEEDLEPEILGSLSGAVVPAPTPPEPRPRPMAAFLGLGGALLLSLAALGFYVMGDDDGDTPPPLAAEEGTAPDTPDEPGDKDPTGDPPPTADKGETTPPVGAPDDPPPRDTPDDEARITIKSVPAGATILVGNEPKDRGPVKLALAPGPHLIGALFSSGVVQRKVTVEADKDMTFVLYEPPTVHIETDPPGADVSITAPGRPAVQGTSPVELQVPLDDPDQPLDVVVEKSGYEKLAVSLPANPGETVEKSFTLDKKRSSASSHQRRQRPPPKKLAPGTLKVFAGPYVNVRVPTPSGTKSMTTPFTADAVKGGRQTLVITNPELGIKDRMSLTVTPGGVTTLKLRYAERDGKYHRVKADVSH